MKTLFTLLTLFLTFNSFGQDLSEEQLTREPKYSENSEIEVISPDTTGLFYVGQKLAGIFVNGTFIGSQEAVSFINSDKIEAITVEKGEFEMNGTKYFGKILITMTSDYDPRFFNLEELSAKYLTPDDNPVIYQIDSVIIDDPNNEILMDENFILKIELKKVKTSGKHTEINLIRLTTKTPENIKKANETLIKSTEE